MDQLRPTRPARTLDLRGPDLHLSRRRPPRGAHRRVDRRRRDELRWTCTKAPGRWRTSWRPATSWPTSPRDVVPLYAALHAPGRLAFAEARCVPRARPRGVHRRRRAHARERVSRDGEKVRIVGDVRHVRVLRVRLINRAEGLLLESLVLATRARSIAAPPPRWRRSSRTTGSSRRSRRARSTNEALAALMREVGARS